MSAIRTRVTAVPYIVKVGVPAIFHFVAAKASLLAALLLHGVRIWPRVWLGAALANFSVNQSLAPGIATGITERKRIEEDLLRTGEPLRTVVDKTPDAIFSKNRGGKYRPVNQAARLRLVALMLALVSPGVVAQTAVETPRTIRVVVDNAYAPYSFQSDDGKLQGILIDQWQAWEKKTGIRVEIHAMDWGEALRRMRTGEFDVIDSIVETPERRTYLDFTPAYATIEASIYFRHDISGITDLASLKGFPVAVKAGDQRIDQFEAHGVTTVIPFQNNDAIVEAAKQHKISVFLANDPSALYLLNKMGIEGEFRHSEPVFRDELRRAVRKGDAALLRTISHGFTAIEPEELKRIDERWFGRAINRYGFYITYAGYLAAVAILLLAGLVGWNRTLRIGILRRTAALGESEHRFRQIAENIREVFWMTTPGRDELLYVSPAYEKVWGRSLESLRQRPRWFIDAIHADDREKVVSIIERGREHGFEVVYRIVRPDGSLRWIRDRGVPVKNESGKVYRVAGVAEDITERKLAEAALKQTDDHLRLVLDTTPTLIHTGRPDGYLDYFNQRWLKYAGLSLEDLQGWAWTATIHPEDVEGIVNSWRASLASGEPFQHEARVRRTDGEYRWMLHHKVALRDEHGNIVKWYGSSIDIEDPKRAEKALRQSEFDLAQAQRVARLGSWNLDTATNAVRWSEELYRVFDVEKTGFRDTYETFLSRVHPDDRTRVSQVNAEARSSGKPFEVEYRIKTRNGQLKHIREVGYARKDLAGAVSGLFGTAQDITEHKRAALSLAEMQARYRQLVELSPDAIHIHQDGRLVFVNSACLRLFGAKSPDQLLGRPLLDFIHPDQREMFRERMRIQYEEKRTIPGVEQKALRLDGSTVDVEVKSAPFTFEGRPAIQTVVRDITERKYAEEALRHSESMLRSVLDTLPVGVWVVDREGTSVQGNPAGKKIWEGTRRVDFKQHSEYKGWWAGTDRLIQVHEWAAARAVERGETSINELVDIECFDGSRKTIKNSAVPMRDSAGHITGAIIVNEDVTARKQTEEAVAGIAAGVSAATGAEFFRLLVEQVTRALGADGVIIGELTGKKEGEARTVAAIMDGEWVEEITYDWRGSPCAIVLNENTVVHSDDARSHFAHTPFLDRFSADSYLGMGLWDADGGALGVMMVINRKPLRNPELAKSILKIVASRVAAELERKRNEETIRSLAIRLQEMIEEERTRIAREIHDELGQALTGLKMDLSWLSKSVEKHDPKVTAQIKSMSEFIDSLIHSVRRISTDLRPGELDDLGLVAAIESQAQEFETRTRIKCRVSLPEADLAVEPGIATAVFRICQELLTNVARHSGATKVSLDLECNGTWLSLAVQDDGRGIRAAEASNRNAIGLAGIRERAKMFGGSVTIKGKAGKGTLAQVRIPLARARDAAHGNGDVAAA